MYSGSNLNAEEKFSKTKYSNDIFDSLIKENDPVQHDQTRLDERREFLRRLGPAALKKWVDTARNLPLSDQDLQALTELQWKYPCFENERLQDFALIAFVRGYIDRFRLAEILIFDECKKQKSLIYTLGKGAADTLLKKSLSEHFTEEELNEFVTRNQGEQFYLRPFERSPDKDILNALLDMGGQSFLTLKTKAGRHYQVVLSPALLNNLFQIKYGKDACLINPVLGESRANSNFKNPLSIDVLVPCSVFPDNTPNIADGFSAPPLEFYHHDTSYHLRLKNSVPLDHLKAVIYLVKSLEEIDLPGEEYIKIQAVIKKLLDGEFDLYSRLENDKTISLSEIFFATIYECLNKVERNENIFGKENLLKLILKIIVDNKEHWKQEFNIDIEALDPGNRMAPSQYNTGFFSLLSSEQDKTDEATRTRVYQSLNSLPAVNQINELSWGDLENAFSKKLSTHRLLMAAIKEQAGPKQSPK